VPQTLFRSSLGQARSMLASTERNRTLIPNRKVSCLRLELRGRAQPKGRYECQSPKLAFALLPTTFTPKSVASQWPVPRHTNNQVEETCRPC
jgi:hypothetical protein